MDTSGDLAREITRSGQALEGKTISGTGNLNGKSIFTSGAEAAVLVTGPRLGSPIATSPALLMLAATQFDLSGNALRLAALLTKPKGIRRWLRQKGEGDEPSPHS